MNYYDQLLQFLDAHRFLVLPGVGTIVIRRTHSHFLEDGNVLESPEYFIELCKVDEGLLRQQMERAAELWKITKQDAALVFTSFSNELKSELELRNFAKLPGIGELQRIGLEIRLESSREIEKKLHYFETNVVIQKPFKLRQNQPKVPEVPKVNRIIALSRTMRWAAASLLLFSMLLIGVGVSPKAKSLLHPVGYSLEGTTYDQNEFNRAPETDGSERNKDVVIDESDWESTEASDMNSSIEGEQTEVKLKRILIFSSEDYDSEEEIEREECTYIAGSFTSSQLATKMKRLLEKEGFITYESQYKKYTRIGVLIPCQEETQLAKLAIIESGYWLLDE